MARLAELIAGFAEVLKMPIGTVRNTAAVLRGAGLLTTGPRGPGAPHMAPTDATNLLLGLMYDDAQELAAANVEKLRAAPLAYSEGRIGFDFGGGIANSLPPHDFVSDGETGYTLGTVLDLLFHDLVRYGTVDWDLADGEETQPVNMLYVGNFSLSVSRPGHSAQLYLDAYAVHWHLTYRWIDPEHVARRDAAAARGEPPMHALAHLGSYMSRSREIRDAELADLTDVLRGGPAPKGDEEAERPYGAWEPVQ